MEAILQSTNVKCHQNSEYDDPDRNTILVLEVDEPLYLTGQIQEAKYGKIK
jgi:hypothetical protein